MEDRKNKRQTRKTKMIEKAAGIDTTESEPSPRGGRGKFNSDDEDDTFIVYAYPYVYARAARRSLIHRSRSFLKCSLTTVCA